MKYQNGDFSWTGKGEAVFAMSQYIAKLEKSLMHNTAPDDQRHHVNREIEDLITKVTRRRNSSMFDLDGFLKAQRTYRSDQEYKNYKAYLKNS